jgi:uncharacterized membrane protein HdeD (DUF308 family)
MTTLTSSLQTGDRSVRWKWFLAVGLVLVLLGLAGAGGSTLLQLTSLLVFGPMLLASSILMFVLAFFAERDLASLSHYAAAGLEMVLAFFIMINPFEGTASLLVWIAVALIAGGLLRLARALALRSGGQIVTLFAGLIALILGLVIYVRWPIAEIWFVGFCIAVDFICHGVSWVVVALYEHKPLEAPKSQNEATVPQPTK